MFYNKILLYKNEIITKFNSCYKLLVSDISKLNEISKNDNPSVINNINSNVNNFIEISNEINLKRRFFSPLNLIESLNIAGVFFSFKSKLHINITLKPVLNDKLLLQFKDNLYHFRNDTIKYLLNLYNDNLISIDEKYYMLCSFSKSWDLLPFKTWNSLFESLTNELHLHSPIQIANIMLIHNHINHLFLKQIYRFKSDKINENDYNFINNNFIYSLGLTLLSKDIQALKPKKIIEIIYLATKRNCKLISFYDIAHKHLIGMNNLTFGNYTTLIRLNTKVLYICLSIFDKHIIENINDIFSILSNIIQCVESYNNIMLSKINTNMISSNIERNHIILKPKYHSILILEALCSKTFLKSLSLIDKHYNLNDDVTCLLKNYHQSIKNLINITLYNINALEHHLERENTLITKLKISGSMYSKFFSDREFSYMNKEIKNMVSENRESHSNLITHRLIN